MSETKISKVRRGTAVKVALLRDLPSIEDLMSSPPAQSALSDYGRPAMVRACRTATAELRRQLLEGGSAPATPLEWLAHEAVRLGEKAVRPRLRPVRVSPEELALRVPISVGPTAMALDDTHPYSMPPEAAEMPATLYLYRDRVRIVAYRFDVTHPRLFERNARSTLPEHRLARLAEVSGKRGKQYLKRQDLLDTGSLSIEFLTEIPHRRPCA